MILLRSSTPVAGAAAFLQEHIAPEDRLIDAPRLVAVELRSGRLEILTRLALADLL